MEYFPDHSKIVIQQLSSAWLSSHNMEIAMLRLDRLHPEISGNKWFKLKYNLDAAKEQQKNAILTFGGAWSNHIAATAAACNLLGLKSIGIIRGEDRKNTITLTGARKHGMQLHFISREEYRKKNDEDYLRKLSRQFHDPYIIPEGGNNDLGLKGCKEILSLCDVQKYTHVCCPVGTGTTLTGLIEYGAEAGRDKAYRVSTIGFAALKNANYLKQKIKDNLSKEAVGICWDLNTDHHFGGFAKKTPALLGFIKDFYDQFGIPLDFVYSAKMMYGVMDGIKQGYFPTGSRLLAIHTGGLQGNRSIPEIAQSFGEINYLYFAGHIFKIPIS